MQIGNKKEKTEMKVMISQPMQGKTAQEILEKRDAAVAHLELVGHEVVNTLFANPQIDVDVVNTKDDNGTKNLPLAHLARSLRFMSYCDAVYFCKGWQDARGCRIEHGAAVAYGLKVIEEE